MSLNKQMFILALMVSGLTFASEKNSPLVAKFQKAKEYVSAQLKSAQAAMTDLFKPEQEVSVIEMNNSYYEQASNYVTVQYNIAKNYAKDGYVTTRNAAQDGYNKSIELIKAYPVEAKMIAVILASWAYLYSQSADNDDNDDEQD